MTTFAFRKPCKAFKSTQTAAGLVLREDNVFQLSPVRSVGNKNTNKEVHSHVSTTNAVNNQVGGCVDLCTSHCSQVQKFRPNKETRVTLLVSRVRLL